MFSVLVVDDQVLVCETLKDNICNYFKEGIIVYTCYDSNSAFEIINANQIDLLITDIAMPVSSGLELIKKVQEIGFNGNIIILTCHNNFEYAQKAIKLKVYEYILKPMTSEKIIDTIYELIDRENLDKFYYNKKLYIYLTGKDVFIQKDNLFEKTHINSMKNSFWICASFDIWEHYKHDYVQLNFQELKSFFDSNGIKFSIAIKNKQVFSIICNCSEERKDIAISKIKDFFMNFKLSYCGISYLNSEFERTEKLFQEAQNSLFAEKSSYNNNFPALDKDDYKFEQNVKNISQYILEDDINKLYLEADDLFFLFDKNSIDLISICQELKTIINKVSSNLEINLNSQETIDSFENLFLSSKSFFELKINFKECVSTFTKISLKEKNNAKNNISNSIKFIHKNFKNDISISYLANICDLNYSYFSSMFKQTTGKSAKEYIIDLRLEYSLHLIENTNLKLYDISKKCGFNDFAHFTKTFKKKYCCSPSKYNYH